MSFIYHSFTSLNYKQNETICVYLFEKAGIILCEGVVYMRNLKNEFFSEKEVLFMGYSSRSPQFSSLIYKAFTDAGIKVFPVNPKTSSKYDVKVYQDLSELPKVPSVAYILMNNKNAKAAVQQLKSYGIKKIMFHRGKTADRSLLDECKEAGIETAVACPLMLYGSGIHKLHAWLAGVK
jgi:predicted CoA-binding protein